MSHVFKRILPLMLILALLFTACGSDEGKMPDPDPTIRPGILAVGIPGGYKIYSYNEDFSYGLAAKWENRPFGKVTVNFCSPYENKYDISMTLTDSESRHMVSTGRITPGTHLVEVQLQGIPAETEEICVTINAWNDEGELVYTTSRYETLIRTYQ